MMQQSLREEAGTNGYWNGTGTTSSGVWKTDPWLSKHVFPFDPHHKSMPMPFFVYLLGPPGGCLQRLTIHKERVINTYIYHLFIIYINTYTWYSEYLHVNGYLQCPPVYVIDIAKTSSLYSQNVLPLKRISQFSNFPTCRTSCCEPRQGPTTIRRVVPQTFARGSRPNTVTATPSHLILYLWQLLSEILRSR